MNNSEAEQNIDGCVSELLRVYHLIEGLGATSPVIPFLTNYSIVRTCGSLEYCFKTIISDAISGESTQIITFIDNTIRKSSLNPSRKNISSLLKKIDPDWNNAFKLRLDEHENSERIKASISSLNNSRNSFAHGTLVTSSFEDIRAYYMDSIEIMKILDEVVTT